MSITVIDSDNLRKNILLNIELVDLIEEALITLATSEVVIPEIQQISLSSVSGQLCVKSAYTAQHPLFVVKMAGSYPQNRRKNIQTTQGCMCLFNSSTGELDSLLVDNGWLTQLRTAASGAVAAKYLAPKIVKKVVVIGAGVQARLQLQALKLVRSYDEVVIFNRTKERAQELSVWVRDNIGVEATVANTVEEAVVDADVIITTTSSATPVLELSMLNLARDIHITAMGSDAPTKNELGIEIFSHASRFVCDLKSQSLKLGELRPVIETLGIDISKVEQIGDICSTGLGRHVHDKLTVCDLTGVAILDLAIATYAKQYLS